MPEYDGDAWVALHQYQRRDWRSLIERWTALNRQLLAAAEAVPDSAWSRTCTIADSGPLTLQFVLDDYIHHMLEHLRHMGVEVEDFALQASACSLADKKRRDHSRLGSVRKCKNRLLRAACRRNDVIHAQIFHHLAVVVEGMGDQRSSTAPGARPCSSRRGWAPAPARWLR